jgi:hypothetical protein
MKRRLEGAKAGAREKNPGSERPQKVNSRTEVRLL